MNGHFDGEVWSARALVAVGRAVGALHAAETANSLRTRSCKTKINRETHIKLNQLTTKFALESPFTVFFGNVY